MQIPNQRVFSLNSAVTPEIQWGTVSPSTNSGNVTLTSMPVGSMYVQQIGGSPITSCIVWVKTVSDIVAAQNLVNPWTAVSQASVADGATYPDFASDEFMAYQPGMIYIHNETKDTGTYRTAWLKVSDGGTRSDWVSLAESESLERVIASITATGLTTDIVESATFTWRYVTTGTPTVLEEEPSTAGIVGSDLRLNVPTDGLYLVNARISMIASTTVGGHLAIAVNGAVSDENILVTGYLFAFANDTVLSGSTLVRLSRDDVVGIAIAVQVAGGSFTLGKIGLSMMLVAP